MNSLSSYDSLPADNPVLDCIDITTSMVLFFHLIPDNRHPDYISIRIIS